MNKKFFSGDSVRQALLQAARHFQVEPEAIDYREVDRRHGFLRGRRRAVIEVDLDHPTRSAGSAEQEERAPEERSDEPLAASSSAAETPPEPAPEPEAEADPEPEPEPEREPERRPAPSEDRPNEEPPVADLEARDDEPAAEREELPTPSFGEVRREPEPIEGGLVSRARPARETEPRETEAREIEEPPAIDAREVVEPAAAPAERPTPPMEDAELADAARRALARLFELGRLDLEVERVEQGEERLEIELRGDDEEFLLEDRGRLLLAIQHLLPRMLRGLTGKSAPVQVDCDDFHEIRTEQLRDLAQRVASEVRNRRRSRTLEPMSPDERRIVHLTLADDPAVETVSQGNGLFKRVQIRPQKMQPRGFDPFGREE